MAKKKSKNPAYIAFDSDLLGNIAIVHDKEQNGIKFETGSFKNAYLKTYGAGFKLIYDKIKSGEIIPVVVNTVYNESKVIPKIAKFMKECCYFPNYTMANKDEKAEEISELATAYTKPYKFKGVEYLAPMKQVYSSHCGCMVPTNDTYAVAEASYENINFVTLNEKDITKTGEDLSYRDKHRENVSKGQKDNYHEFNTRSIGVVTINRDMGYYSPEDADKKYSIPCPIGFTKFIETLESGSLQPLTPRDEFIRGKDVMEI